MTDIRWDIISVIVGIIGILVTLGIFFWKRHKKNKATPKKIKKGLKKPKNPKPQKVNKDISGKNYSIEPLLNEKITIPYHSNEYRRFDFVSGDRIIGEAEDTRRRTFSIYVMDEKNFHDYQNDEDYRCEGQYMDIIQAYIFVDIPHDDTWYIVFDTLDKRVDRRVKITLEKKTFKTSI